MAPFQYLFNTLSAILFAIIGWSLIWGEQTDWSSTGRIGVAFLSAIVCALIGNSDRIESLKASLSGIEAKTREATNVVAEARVALRELHVLAEMTGSLLIELMAGSGRFGGGPLGYDERRRTRVLEALTTIGLSPEALRRVNAGDRYWVLIDYSLGILHRISKSAACSPELKALASGMLQRWNKDDFRPTPDDFSAMLEEAPCADNEVMELINDYKHYARTKTHRRPAVWQERRRWPR